MIKIKKEVCSYIGITIKGKETSSYLAKILLAAHSTCQIGYYLYLFIRTEFQLGSNIHVCTKETHLQANLQVSIHTLAGLCCLYLCRD